MCGSAKSATPMMSGSTAAALLYSHKSCHPPNIRTIPSPESQHLAVKQMLTRTLTTAVLGSSLPPFTPHAISVCLPTWRDNVGYEEGEKRVVDSMVTGYPRFFIHKSIRKVCGPPTLVHLFTQLTGCRLMLLF